MESLRRVKLRRVLDSLAVPSEPGLTNAQLMLTNHDLKPGEYNATWKEFGGNEALIDSICDDSGTGAPSMGSLEFRRILDCRFIQHCAFRKITSNALVIC